MGVCQNFITSGWIGKCVGRKNHALFLVFVASQFVHLVIGLYLALCCVSSKLEYVRYIRYSRTISFGRALWRVFALYPGAFLLVPVVALLTLFISAVLLTQLVGISSNTLVNEMLVSTPALNCCCARLRILFICTFGQLGH